jgi:hypothetical protein
LFAIGNGIVLWLTGITFHIGKNLTVQNFTVLVRFLTEIVPIDVIFLLLNPFGLGIPLFHAYYAVVGSIDSIIIIGGLLVRTAGGHDEGSNHQYGGGS